MASKVMVAVEEEWEDEVVVEEVAAEAWVVALTGTTETNDEIAYQCVIDQSDS